MQYEIWIDGSSRPKLLNKKKAKVGPSSSSFIVKQDNTTIYMKSKYSGILDNNQAEYEALLMALEHVIDLNIKPVKIYTDSNLIECQMNGKYNSYSDLINNYYLKGKELLKKIESYEIVWIPRSSNREADSMCRMVINDMVKNGKL